MTFEDKPAEFQFSVSFNPPVFRTVGYVDHYELSEDNVTDIFVAFNDSEERPQSGDQPLPIRLQFPTDPIMFLKAVALFNGSSFTLQPYWKFKDILCTH